jgi:hypothetical protein
VRILLGVFTRKEVLALPGGVFPKQFFQPARRFDPKTDTEFDWSN